MVKRFVIVMLAVLTLGLQAFAQNVVSGKVTDDQGEPLIGVGIQVKGTQTGTMTDLDGYYSLVVSPNATLVYSYIGFLTQEVGVGSRKTVNVSLAPDNMFLDDVVVVGYGTARKKDVSGAIQSVNYGKDENISSLPNPNALAALSSKVAGLNYAPTTSAAGDNTQTMTIRGKNAIPTSGSMSASAQSVNKPLLVVDGVLSYDSINSINTADIESIDVLKDASAAAIYGSRAANGVIIITTKKGTNEAPVVRFNGSVSISDWTRMPKMVSDKETFLKNRFYSRKGSGTDDYYKDKEWNYSSLDAAAHDNNMLSARELEAWDDGQWVNWLEEISRKGVGQKYDVSVSGRSERVNYYVSGDYTRQQGIRKGDDYGKTGALAKIDFKLTDWLTVGVKANFLSSKSWGQSANIRYAMWYTPLSYVYARQDGFQDWYNAYPDEKTASPFIGTGEDDSYAYTDRNSRSINLNGVAYAQVDFPFIPGLSYRVTFQGQRNSSFGDVYNKPEMWVDTEVVEEMQDPSRFIGNVTGTVSSSNYYVWNIDQILTYGRDFGRHHFDVTAGYTREATDSNTMGASFQGFPTPTQLGVYNIEVANNYTNVYRNRTETQAVGYLARVNYNFANKYYLTGNFRRDGFSAFAPGHKWGNFYGASAAWVLSNEDFIKDTGAFDFLKLRLSWGQNGARNIGAGATQSTMSKSTSNNGALTMAWLGDESTLGMTLTNLPNRALTWATVEKLNLGVDFAVLNSRLNGSVDLYTGRTTNMLVYRSAPYISGFNNVNDNVGLVTNKGVEVVLNTVNVNGNGRETFRWESNIVFDSNANKLVSLFGPDYNGDEADDVANAVSYGREAYYALLVGRPIGAAYDVKKLGIFQNQTEIDNYKSPKTGEPIQPNAKPGDLKFEDYNEDGQINADDFQYLGSPDPLFTLNFANTFSWHNFSLYFNFRWAQGDKTHFIWLDPYAFGTTMTGGAQLAAVKPWMKEGDPDTYPRYGYTKPVDYQYWNSRSYLKLKDLVFSYSIPETVLKPCGISSLRAYVAATDLLTFTNWSGTDPETGGTIAAGASSSRFGSNGAYKTVTFGVNLTFAGAKLKAKAPVGYVPQVKEIIKEVVKEKVVEKPVEKIVEKVVYKGSNFEGLYEDDLYFLIGKSEIRPDEAFKLGRICQILKDNPDAKISVTGYADSGTGNDEINNTLSQQRAAVVVDMLKKAGIEAGRITSAAIGGDKDANASPESNRVAVCIVK